MLSDEWPPVRADASLADVKSVIAVFVSGENVDLLRLADGRSAVIRIAGKGPINAKFGSPGLFYSYGTDDARHRGRVIFVPFKKLPLG